MTLIRRASTSVLLSLSLILLSNIAPADDPSAHKLEGFTRTKQLTNYCGPACMSSIFKHFGKQISQEAIGREVYDRSSNATNGADMLFYARQVGYSSYTWNSSLQDVKRKIAAGIPVIVLQQNTLTDTSGHYRVLTGYDDATGKFSVMDPYYDHITEMTYGYCERLWRPMGYWAMAFMPVDRDIYKVELGEKNPVLHMDLSFAYLKRKQYDEALKQAKMALELEPNNRFALSLMGKIQAAGKSGKK